MTGVAPASETLAEPALPSVSVVFLAYNQRARLLESVGRMLTGSGVPRERLEVIVVDNASEDGTADAVAAAHPEVRVVRNPVNVGAPGWNAGFAIARGDYVLILDDDAYLEAGGLAIALRAAADAEAGLVSFHVVSSYEPTRALADDWNTGLLSYWGCAALVDRRALEQLGGYDPNIFIWGNEAELTMRLLDRGFAHLLLPEVRAVHMKPRITSFDLRRYLVNARHHAYIAAKLMTPVDAAATLGSIALHAMIDARREDRAALGALREAAAGCTTGLRHRHPVRDEVSRAYRRNFAAFAPPWRFMRSPAERVVARVRGRDVADGHRARRHERFFADRAAFYPRTRASLRL